MLGCRNDCPDLSENQQLVVAGCAEGSCSDARTCLDIDCFNDGDCSGGRGVRGRRLPMTRARRRAQPMGAA